MTDKYYERARFECKNCGKLWQSPGAAELCWNKDELLNKLEEVENHKAFYLPDVIDDIEKKIEEGEYDYQNNEQ